jgi:hypothetical protein
MATMKAVKEKIKDENNQPNSQFAADQKGEEGGE